MGIILPICAVTGRIAGDRFACGDCDPCSSAHLVPPVVKALMKERDEFADKYEDATCERTDAANEIERLRDALEPFADVARWASRNGHDLKDFDMLLRHMRSGEYFGHLQVQAPDFIRSLAALDGSHTNKNPADPSAGG